MIRLAVAMTLFLGVVAPAGCAPGRGADAVPLHTDADPARSHPSDLPPLLDRALFFGGPAVSGPRISREGKYVTFHKRLNGVPNIWIKAVDERRFQEDMPKEIRQKLDTIAVEPASEGHVLPTLRPGAAH